MAYKNELTKKQYENWLNELGIPDSDLRSNGGRIPDNHKYGTWLKNSDPIAFNVGFNESVREAHNS